MELQRNGQPVTLDLGRMSRIEGKRIDIHEIRRKIQKVPLGCRKNIRGVSLALGISKSTSQENLENLCVNDHYHKTQTKYSREK